MSTLLVQSCSGTKRRPDGAVSAMELYTGYFFRIINKARREGELRDDLDICILSAEHGIVDPWEPLAYYDRRMNSTRARELNDDIVDSLQRRVQSNGYDRVVVNMGRTYQTAIDGFADNLDIDVRWVAGEGIGHKGRTLKQFIRGDDTTLESYP